MICMQKDKRVIRIEKSLCFIVLIGSTWLENYMKNEILVRIEYGYVRPKKKNFVLTSLSTYILNI